MNKIHQNTMYELKVEAPEFGFVKSLKGTALELGLWDSLDNDPEYSVTMVQEILRDEWPHSVLVIPLEDFIDECRIIFVEQYGEPIDWEEKVVANLSRID